MTFEQFIAAWIVGSSLVSATLAMVTVVVLLHRITDEAAAMERRRRGDRLDAGLDGVEGARSEDPGRAAALRVFRMAGSMNGNARRGR